MSPTKKKCKTEKNVPRGTKNVTVARETKKRHASRAVNDSFLSSAKQLCVTEREWNHRKY